RRLEAGADARADLAHRVRRAVPVVLAGAERGAPLLGAHALEVRVAAADDVGHLAAAVLGARDDGLVLAAPLAGGAHVVDADPVVVAEARGGALERVLARDVVADVAPALDL